MTSVKRVLFLVAMFLFLILFAKVLASFSVMAPTRAPFARVGGATLNLILATTTADEERGLGGRDSLPSDAAMLFVFPKDDRYGFWMKDMRFPLDILWLSASSEGGPSSGGQVLKVITVVSDIATSTYPNVFYPSAPARYVLETNAGFAASHGVSAGTVVRLQNIPSVSK